MDTSSNSLLFSPYKLGPLTIRNRSIRAAAFEGMCFGNIPSGQLLGYHKSVAEGGIGMTTLAYAAVNRSGLSFPHQLLMHKEISGSLQKITESIHASGAAVSIQLGHCGNMSKKSVAGIQPISPSGGVNIYSPTLTRKMTRSDIKQTIKSFTEAVELSYESGFDAVEIHAGHGYLISQFLSPYTNHRNDDYGGNLRNRSRFMMEVIDAVLNKSKKRLAVLVKINMHDGFKQGMQEDECLEVALMLQSLGVDALILSGGFVSKAPMYILRGSMPIKTLTHYMKNPWLKISISLAGKCMIPSIPYQETYFLDQALKFRKELKLPLVYVGGLISGKKINEVLNHGFEMVSMARALITEPDFINKLKTNPEAKSQCCHANYCIARMYSMDMACHLKQNDLPVSITAELKKNREHNQ